MRLTAAFTAHEVTTQLRSARFRLLAVAYVAIGAIPAVALYLASRNFGYRIDGGAYAQALRAILPSLTALFATVLAVDAINREQEEGSFGVISLAPISASGYVFRRWLALLVIAVPVTMLPLLIGAGLAAHAERRMPDVAPLAWEWLLHVVPALLVMSGLMLALGTITGRTLLAILVYGAAMTFGLGFLQDLLAMAHRHLEGPGAMIGFDPYLLARVTSSVRGWWQFEPPTDAGYPLELELERLLPEAALIVACTIFFLGFAPAFLRRTRPDVKPWRIREDHPLRTILRGINRMRENYRPDAGLQPIDRAVMVLAVIVSLACLGWLLRRETHFMNLAAERFAAEESNEPREMHATLVPRTISIEGDAGRVMRTRTTFAIENRGDQPQHHLGFAIHPGLTIERVDATCGRATLTRKWERVGIDLDKPIAARATCNVTIALAGTPDAVIFSLWGGHGRFGTRYRNWLGATETIELSDLSRSTFLPAATRSRMLLTARDFAPVPRYTPWQVDGNPINVMRDHTSFVPERIAPSSDIHLALKLPDGLTAVDSCGKVTSKKLESRCAFAFADFRITAARFTAMPLGGRATLVHLISHDDVARVHAPSITEALAVAEASWPGLRMSGNAVIVERPIDGDGERAAWRRPSNPIESSGSMYAIPEWILIRRKPLAAQGLAAALIGSTLRSRREIVAAEQQFFSTFIEAVANARAGAGQSRSAVIGGGGPRPSTEPLLHLGWGDHSNVRLRGVLADLEYRVGADRVVEGMNEFVARPGPGNAKELLDIIGRRANVSLDNVYRDFFTGTALPKLTLEDATFVRDGKRWVVRGFARNLARGESLVPIVLRTQFGSVRQTLTVGAGERVPFTLTTEHEPRTLQLDPDRVVYRWAAIGTVDSIDFRGES